MSTSPCHRVPSRVLRAAALVSVGFLLAACSYPSAEPGLFGRPSASREVRVPIEREAPTAPPTNPDLPVLGERVWNSADGLGVQARIAVHAVRRIERATVLDWSVTPLKGHNLQVGDAVSPSIQLGLSQAGTDRPRVRLVDFANDRLFRPLISSTGGSTCVCTPLRLAQRNFRVGHTTLLQVAFPEVPASAKKIDVSFATLVPFSQVPVTPMGYVPVAERPTQLARPAEPSPSADVYTAMFRYGPDDQIFRFRIDEVLASPTFTTLRWTIWSVTGGRGLDSASTAPFAESATTRPRSVEAVTTSGPTLITSTPRGEQTMRARLAQSEIDARSAECLCTPLTSWAPALGGPDKPAAVVTNYPPLSAATRRVRVEFDRLGAVELPVVRAGETGQPRAASMRELSTWRNTDLSSRSGWAPTAWPPPIPSSDQLPRRLSQAYPVVR